MNLAKKVMLVLALATWSAFAQSRDERWQADLDALHRHILATHPNPFTRYTPEAFERRVADVRSRISALTDGQIVVEFSGIVAMLDDGHSNLSAWQPGTSVRRYQVAVRWFSDGLFITGALQRWKHLIGTRIVSINGRPIAEVAANVGSFHSQETESWARYQSETALMINEFLVAAGVATLDGTLRLELEPPNGERFVEEITLGGSDVVFGPVAARPILPFSRRTTGQDYWFEWIESERVLYIQYSRCRESVLLPVRTFVDEILAFSRDHPPERWVFDLRDNIGGDESVFLRMFYWLLDAVKQGRLPRPERGIYGIIAKRTFSSGTLAARELRSNGAILVGEMAGGRLDWFGHPPDWVLPNSRLAVGISRDRIGNGSGQIIFPDSVVEFKGMDYFAFTDPFLASALER